MTDACCTCELYLMCSLRSGSDGDEEEPDEKGCLLFGTKKEMI